jgi:FAD:protein FMN transferase
MRPKFRNLPTMSVTLAPTPAASAKRWRDGLRQWWRGSGAAAHEAGCWMQGCEAIMGTSITVELWAESAEQGQAAIDAVMAEMHRINGAMSPHLDDSELSRINREAGHGPVALSQEMALLLSRALLFSKLTEGAFDISYASAGQLYDYREGIVPSEAALAGAREAIGWQHLLLDPGARTLAFAKPGMRIDLGGFAKGHAVDNATGILKALGIHHAWVAAGGDSRVIGDKRGRPWSIGVRDPADDTGDKLAAVLPLVDCAVSTSGDYERGFVRDGVRHHHILDPRTGRSAQVLRSVTVLADDGLTAEALSKCIFVLGPERGLAIAERVAGVDALAIDAQGHLHATPGLSEHPPAAKASA